MLLPPPGTHPSSCPVHLPVSCGSSSSTALQPHTGTSPSSSSCRHLQGPRLCVFLPAPRSAPKVRSFKILVTSFEILGTSFRSSASLGSGADSGDPLPSPQGLPTFQSLPAPSLLPLTRQRSCLPQGLPHLPAPSLLSVQPAPTSWVRTATAPQPHTALSASAPASTDPSTAKAETHLGTIKAKTHLGTTKAKAT